MSLENNLKIVLKKQNRCDECKWYAEVVKDKGYCRRFPPQLDHDTGTVDSFPLVQDDWWCGEYKFGHREKKNDNNSDTEE